MLDRISEAVSSLSLDPANMTNLIISLVTIVVLIVLRLLVLRVIQQRISDNKTFFVWRKAATYTSVFIGFLILGRVWISGFSDLATFLGLLSAGIAVALRDWVTNFFGWVFLILRRPFRIGDRIELDGHRGDVIDIRVFASSILEIGNWVDADQSTGRVIHIPNSKILNTSLANYTSGFPYIWEEIKVLITFESDWEKGKAILTKIAQTRGGETVKKARDTIQQASRRWMIHYANLSPIVYTSVRDSGVEFTLRFMCAPRTRRSQTEEIWEEILREFARHDDLDFAYPTRRFYNNQAEGKPGKAGVDREQE